MYGDKCYDWEDLEKKSMFFLMNLIPICPFIRH